MDNSFDLQLRDYSEGYRFYVICKHCSFEWHEWPDALLADETRHQGMYLDDVAKTLTCQNCKGHSTKITPLLVRSTHHFVGGLA